MPFWCKLPPFDFVMSCVLSTPQMTINCCQLLFEWTHWSSTGVRVVIFLFHAWCALSSLVVVAVAGVFSLYGEHLHIHVWVCCLWLVSFMLVLCSCCGRDSSWGGAVSNAGCGVLIGFVDVALMESCLIIVIICVDFGLVCMFANWIITFCTLVFGHISQVFIICYWFIFNAWLNTSVGILAVFIQLNPTGFY